jgi:hypothetical protein
MGGYLPVAFKPPFPQEAAGNLKILGYKIFFIFSAFYTYSEHQGHGHNSPFADR